MSKLKHTPGPWMAQISDVSAAYITAERKAELIGHDVIGSVNPQLGKEVADANARLIAAAPEMLEVLKECEYELKASRLYGLLDWARLVIANAEGST